MSKTIARQLKRLPNSWMFGVLWMAALLTMAAGAAQADERVLALLRLLARLATAD